MTTVKPSGLSTNCPNMFWFCCHSHSAKWIVRNETKRNRMELERHGHPGRNDERKIDMHVISDIRTSASGSQDRPTTAVCLMTSTHTRTRTRIQMPICMHAYINYAVYVLANGQLWLFVWVKINFRLCNQKSITNSEAPTHGWSVARAQSKIVSFQHSILFIL